jgi:hypothetical protein
MFSGNTVSKGLRVHLIFEFFALQRHHENPKRYKPKVIGSRFRVQGLPAFGGARGDQDSKVIVY